MDLEKVYARLREQHGNGDLPRRQFLARIAQMALGAGLFGSGLVSLSRLAHGAGTIRHDGYGGVSQGAYNKLVLQPFTAATGTTVNQGSYGTPQELIAKIQADGIQNYNFCNVSDQATVLRMVRLGFGAELDAAKIPRIKDVIPRAVDAYRRIGNGRLAAVPFGMSGGWIGYNKDKIERAEIEAKGYGILLDPKYKGSIIGQDNWLQRIWLAAIQTGQDPNAINDMAAVWGKIRDSKGMVLKYWRTSAEQMLLFSNGSALVGDTWFVPSFNLMKQGAPIATWPKTGTYVDFGCLMVFKSAPLDAAYEIFDILLRPQVMIALAEEVGNVPLLDPTKHAMPPAVQALPGFDPTGTLDGYRSFDPFYWTENSDAWQKEYTRVLARA